MPDDDLRALERAAVTGDAQAGARWLAARRRIGALSSWGLELAAYAGDPAAQLALLAERPLCVCGVRSKTHSGRCPLKAQPTAATPNAFWIPWPLWNWLNHLPADPQVLARSALAIASLLPTGPQARGRMTVEEKLQLVEAWLECPCARHKKALRKARSRDRGSASAATATAVVDFAVDIIDEQQPAGERRVPP